MREIVRASAWAGFRELVEEFGGDADDILAAAHVDVAALANSERYMPLKALIDSQAIAAERLGRPDFGLLFGTRQDLAMLGALYLAIVNSATARQSIDICARYLHIHNPALTMALAPVPRTTREFLDLHLEIRRPARLEQNAERMLASIHKALRQIGGRSYKPYQVWFMHAPLSPLST
ncbi:MAG TPA: AraC family transcriptional regulator ligand-binding domain-containing protein, partial [Hyphomonadaceae bacterium]|nr:AraC family transcriptional regulator ligand-binding domain-containing protein [Hyphomonadaceae bacterium]